MSFSIESADTRVSLKADNNELRIMELVNKADGYNWINSSEGSVFPLLDRVRLTGDSKDRSLNWIFDAASSSQVFNGTGSKISFVFYTIEPALTLSSVWESKDNACGPIEHGMRVINHSGKTVTVYQQESLSITLCSESIPRAWYVRKGSRTNNAFDNVRNDTVEIGYQKDIFTIPHEGFSNFIPWLSLNDVEKSRGLYIGWEWPDGRIGVRCEEEKKITIKAGLGIPYVLDSWVPNSQFHSILEFKTDIANGETFTIPKAFIGAYSSTNTKYARNDQEKCRMLVDDGSNRMRKWLFKYNMPEINRRDPRMPEIEYSSNHAIGLVDPDAPDGQIGMTGNDGRKLLKIVKDLQQNRLDFDSICVDNGWPGILGEYNNDPVYWPALDENSDLPVMCQYSDLVRICGFKRLQLYFAFHDGHSTEKGALSSLNENGELTRPEWFCTKQYDNPVNLKMPYYQLRADLGNVKCLETTKRLITKKLKEYRVDSVKLDYDPIIHDSDYQDSPDSRHHYGRIDTGYWSAIGFYEFMQFLIDCIPGFKCQMNNCGGNMRDYASAKFGAVIPARDDCGYGMLPEQCRVALYQSLYCFPAMQLMAPFAGDYSVCGAYRYRSWMIAAPFTMTEAPEDMSEEEIGILRNCIRSYKENVRDLVRNGNVFHILPDPCNGDWDGLEYYDDTTGKGIAMLFKGKDKEGRVLDQHRNVKLWGLDPACRYILHFEDGSNEELEKKIFIGESLMTEGIDLTLGGFNNIASEWLFFETTRK